MKKFLSSPWSRLGLSSLVTLYAVAKLETALAAAGADASVAPANDAGRAVP